MNPTNVMMTPFMALVAGYHTQIAPTEPYAAAIQNRLAEIEKPDDLEALYQIYQDLTAMEIQSDRVSSFFSETEENQKARSALLGEQSAIYRHAQRLRAMAIEQGLMVAGSAFLYSGEEID